MNVFIVYTHPEPNSLNSTLRKFAESFLEESGHEVVISDLYKMQWKAVADGDDFLDYNPNSRLFYMKSSAKAFSEDSQSPDIAAEQKKLLWADVIIFQFPFWWFGLPAILKGWIDRVYAFGFAYGTGKYGGKYWGNRYGEGTLKGKKAMLSITIGGREPQYQERGINGNIDDLLFPIHHGILWYPGISVLPPHVLYRADSVTQERLTEHLELYKKRLANLENTTPIPYRFQNNGEYDDKQQLKKEFVNGSSGFSIHIKNNQ